MRENMQFLVLLLMIIFVSSVSAENGLESFDAGDEIIAPPPPPETETYDIFLELMEYQTKNLISDIHVEVELYNDISGEDMKTLKYVGENGFLVLSLEQATWRIVLKVDKIETDGKDYYREIEINLGNNLNQTVYLFPVGSVMGVVYERGKAVKNAVIKFDCSADYGETNSAESDDYGLFTNYWLAIGSCKISAIYGNKVGYETVAVEHGKLTEAEITLTRGVFSGYNLSYFIIIILIIFLTGYFLILYIRKSRKEEKIIKKTERIEGPKEIEKKVSNRTEDIIKTLKEKEKKVVEFLIENKNKSTQSKIKYEVGIPKTTLIRILQGLELKNIVKIEKIGKLKKVELTNWFLGNE